MGGPGGLILAAGVGGLRFRVEGGLGVRGLRFRSYIAIWRAAGSGPGWAHVVASGPGLENPQLPSAQTLAWMGALQPLRPLQKCERHEP